MNISDLSPDILTHTAIAALKNASEECTETSVKNSINTACKAILQLHQDLCSQVKADENDNDCDPSEYCAAV